MSIEICKKYCHKHIKVDIGVLKADIIIMPKSMYEGAGQKKEFFEKYYPAREFKVIPIHQINATVVNCHISGGFREKELIEDVKYLVGHEVKGEDVYGFLEIIKPEIVICLGKEVYGVVAKALGKGVSSAELKRYYQKLDEGSNFVKPEGRGWSFMVYGMAHPGGMGVANRMRKGKKDNMNLSGLDLQCEDWKYIKKMVLENIV